MLWDPSGALPVPYSGASSFDKDGAPGWTWGTKGGVLERCSANVRDCSGNTRNCCSWWIRSSAVRPMAAMSRSRRALMLTVLPPLPRLVSSQSSRAPRGEACEPRRCMSVGDIVREPVSGDEPRRKLLGFPATALRRGFIDDEARLRRRMEALAASKPLRLLGDVPSNDIIAELPGVDDKRLPEKCALKSVVEMALIDVVSSSKDGVRWRRWPARSSSHRSVWRWLIKSCSAALHALNLLSSRSLSPCDL